MADENDPEAVVQAQLDAYNAHDADMLAAIYAADAEQYQHPSTLLARGSEQIQARFSTRFAEAAPQAKLHKRIVAGRMVIDHETVTSRTAQGSTSADIVAIYEVRDGRIVKAWFMSGPSVEPFQS
jgi:uncharacterized protein (TIGR02246 family)